MTRRSSSEIAGSRAISEDLRQPIDRLTVTLADRVVFNSPATRRPASAPKWLSLHALEATCANSTLPSANACASAIRAHSRKDFAILSYLEVVGARRIVSSVTCGHFSHWTVLKGLRLSLSVQVALWAYTYLAVPPLTRPPSPRALSFSIFFSSFSFAPCSTVCTHK